MLAITASDTDATNQSYYGEQKLHFLSSDGKNDCLVPLPKVCDVSLALHKGGWVQFLVDVIVFN